MRQISRWIVAIGLSLVLLTWLLVRSLDPGHAASLRLAETLRDLGANEVAMQRNVLRARAGLLRDYDPLVQTMAATRADAAALRQRSPPGTALAAQAGEIERRVAAEEDLVEQFKTGNALLQNSSAFFDQLATGVMAGPDGGSLALASGSLAAAMLQLSHEASPEATAAVTERLDALAGLAAASEATQQTADASILVEHGRMLSEMIATVDSVVKSLLARSSLTAQSTFLAELDRSRLSGEQLAQRFRLALYAVSLLLLALLVGLGIQLRARAAALRRRSDIERLIARLSARLIGCAPEETDAVLQEALAALGGGFAADRCYLLRPGLLRPGDPVICQCWQAPGVAAPADWPHAAIGLAQPDGLTFASTVASLPAGPMRQRLARAGVGAWAGTSVYHAGALIGLVGLDRIRSDGRWPAGGPGLLSLATEVVASALRRQFVLRERTDLELRLSRARRLEAVGTFASGIAHNFNNVVGAILGHAEMAGDGLAEEEPRARHVDEIRRAGERARELVAHILDYGSRGSQARRPVDIDRLLGETISLLQASTPAVLSLHCGEEGGHGVPGESGQLQQVFVNLIRNAAQASPAKATVAVEVAALQEFAPLQLSHGELAAGRYVRVSVADRGIGMDGATLRRLFQPFFTTRPGGTGLGLATAWEIVRDHDGALDVQSTPGSGTVFAVWLPALGPDRAPEAAGRGGGDEAILVLNPDETSRHRDEDLLAALGYEPVGYDRVEPAWAAWQAEPGQFGAFVVDRAAAFNGAQPTPGLLQLAVGGKPIIVLGADVEDLAAAQLACLGIVDVIARPVRSSALAACLGRCLAQGAS